jgi:ParG
MSDRIDLLLHKALQTLDVDERDELLRSLLLGRLTAGMSSSAGVVGPVAAPRAAVDRERLASLFGWEIEAPVSSGAQLKVLPVRLPEADHERLRQFCQASGFSMAVVIRTLVERFLDQHAPAADQEE